MEQLILHLFGDYILQTNWMATDKGKFGKRSYYYAALTHAIVYSIPFMIFLEPSFQAIMVILWTHFFIDRFRLARYVVFAKNWITEPHLKWADCSATGYPNDMPPWLSVWLLIIADNTLHLACNYLALRYL